MEVTADSLTFGIGVGRLAPFSRAKWTVQRDDIARIERTQNGVRFYAKNRPDPWVTASVLGGRFLRRLAELEIEAPGPIRPSTWTTI
jgi:hypothetical protein